VPAQEPLAANRTGRRTRSTAILLSVTSGTACGHELRVDRNVQMGTLSSHMPIRK
jgi:hypothetical protein